MRKVTQMASAASWRVAPAIAAAVVVGAATIVRHARRTGRS